MFAVVCGFWVFVVRRELLIVMFELPLMMMFPIRLRLSRIICLRPIMYNPSAGRRIVTFPDPISAVQSPKRSKYELVYVPSLRTTTVDAQGWMFALEVFAKRVGMQLLVHHLVYGELFGVPSL
jgi:hypothetical protein